jgi:hypothetical protein
MDFGFKKLSLSFKFKNFKAEITPFSGQLLCDLLNSIDDFIWISDQLWRPKGFAHYHVGTGMVGDQCHLVRVGKLAEGRERLCPIDVES